jgi:spore maturation protein SpmB
LKTAIRDIFVSGVIDGTRMALRILLIMIPVSLAVAVLQWLGWLAAAAEWIAPGFALVGVRGEGALVFLSGALLNCYSAIAVIVTIPFTGREITILALMVLVSHNLLVETAIQKKIGTPIFATLLLRLAASLALGVLLNCLMPAAALLPPSAFSLPPSALHPPPSFSDAMLSWAAGSLATIAKIMLLLIGLMILHETFQKTGIIRVLEYVLLPVVWLMGLSKHTAFLWVVANTLGLAYGGGILIKQKEEGSISHRHLTELNASMAVCHSLLEDSLLFMATGAGLFWIVVPRVLFAALVVWLYRGLTLCLGRGGGDN